MLTTWYKQNDNHKAFQFEWQNQLSSNIDDNLKTLMII